jgi:flagellar hook-associated protein 2
MASIGSLGVGSGMDLNGLLDKIAAAERLPLNAIRSRQASYSAKVSAYGSVMGMLTSLQLAADKLADAKFATGFKSSSSATTVLAASSDATAVAGSYPVVVDRLAQAQTLVARGVAGTTDDIGADAATITIDFGSIEDDPAIAAPAFAFDAASGTYSGAMFTADAAKSAISVDLEAGKTSLADVRDAINAAAKGAVTASIVNDGSSNRLVLTAAATGQKSSMRVSVAGGNTDLQGLLANDPAGTQNLKQTAAAQDAALTVNGIAVTSAANTVSGAMQGVTLTLVDKGSSTVKVERDTASAQTAINEFVGAYNKLDAKLKELTAFNAGSKSGGVLLGDGTARSIQARVRSALFEAVPGLVTGDPQRLSDLGIAIQKDGSLVANSTKLGEALASRPEAVGRLFGGDATVKGVADTLSALIGTFTQDKSGEAEDGLLTLAMSGAKNAVTNLDQDYGKLEDRIDAKIEIYRAQFRQLDSIMSGMTATSNYLSTQFAALAKQTK